MDARKSWLPLTTDFIVHRPDSALAVAADSVVQSGHSSFADDVENGVRTRVALRENDKTEWWCLMRMIIILDIGVATTRDGA